MAEIWDDYVPTPQQAANRPVPADGADPTAQEFRVTFEDIYDRLNFLEELMNTSPSRFRMLRHVEFDYTIDPIPWRRRFNPGDDGGWREETHNGSAASPHKLIFPLDAPQGCTILSLRAKIDPAPHAVLPETMPRLALYKYVTGGPIVLVADETDPSASTAAFGAQHNIDVTSINEVIDNTSTLYYVVFFSEAGGDAEDDLHVSSVRVEFSQTHVDGGAS